ncbi:Jac1p [Sugiyamaella lignohabitans]|uniref:Jac1p n=1 Tax=Sugiyamaella lignohabitans TaxID=796027 RepID=A0A167EXQ0_9ASCO|nr:Jac1p [Sugiyamaella lignohabitans]ANB14582.1 Jac1p [Sugiyamaella lignohabitans]
MRTVSVSTRLLQTFTKRFATKAGGESGYYSFFPQSFPNGPPPKGPFEINAKQLKQEFLKLQAQTHPDKAGSVDPNNELRKKFELRSSQLNIAYKSLLNPLDRAQHLLLLRGIDALSERDSLQDEDLLMDVLMAREAIADSNSREDLLSLQQENDKRLSESETALISAFSEDDLESAKNETIRLSYWQNIKNQISDALNQ